MPELGMEIARKAMAFSSQDQHYLVGRFDDRFSVLPESIIYRIFSFLDANETVRISLVSKTFRKLCLNSPYLYFCANFDSNVGSQRYSQFCVYVNKVMKLREKLKIGLERFVFHWFCKQAKYNVGRSVADSCLKVATQCNVRELDVLVDLDDVWRQYYFLPDCLYGCKSLEVLRLNLQMGKFNLLERKMDSVEDLLLDSLAISDRYFGDKISEFWTSLRRLKLENVKLDCDLHITSHSVEELKMSHCTLVRYFTEWNFRISTSSLKCLCISRCRFQAPCHLSLRCPSLENFTIHRSYFEKHSTFKISSASLENFRICGSYFEKPCVFIFYESVKHIEMRSCTFEGFCNLDINSLDLEEITVSDCELIRPKIRKSIFEPVSTPVNRIQINVDAEKLQTLTINSSDEYLLEFPLSISAPNIKAIRWKGNPVDFSYLESFMSLVTAAIDIKPSCQHKSKARACHCNLVKSSIYCVALLLQSLKYAKQLKINIWPIETFFMQNDFPIFFNNLVCLILTVDDSLSHQIPVIVSFLKGLPNLERLTIKCAQNSPVLSDPNFINLLGLCPETFNLSLREDWKRVDIINKRKAEEVSTKRE